MLSNPPRALYPDSSVPSSDSGHLLYCRQVGSGFIESGSRYGSRSSISSESGSGYRSRVLMTKNYKKNSWNIFFFFWSKIALQKINLFQMFYIFLSQFLPSWIRIQGPNWIRIRSGSGSTTLTVGALKINNCIYRWLKKSEDTLPKGWWADK